MPYARAVSRTASAAARRGTTLARSVTAPSTACASEFAALAARASGGCEAESSGSLTTIAGRTPVTCGPEPVGSRCLRVISAADRVVGIPATRGRPPRPAATAFAVSMTRPPPRATISSASSSTSSSSAADSSSTGPAAT
ncbi:MAG: hypothetical protein AVDCRST_MAG85-1896 [uncultured Solirubrobacteraceae bacterium]|uniref:Uncharacterized protein n=1 Tax=uncultured Solirubrobacteraceae bacterium TaxID=1162706 RepID=A0A6J4SRA3_9ACTN|nr:MAG: hypothetical protein AVDCRST_MAG85-1896 [uncultured Solirubrobacteraceae bacterium]